MQNFIVLGYIPGTQIQINFTAWLILSSLFCLLVTAISRRQAVRTWLVSMWLKHYFKHLPIDRLAL